MNPPAPFKREVFFHVLETKIRLKLYYIMGVMHYLVGKKANRSEIHQVTVHCF